MREKKHDTKIWHIQTKHSLCIYEQKQWACILKDRKNKGSKKYKYARKKIMKVYSS
jgi:hypothetical protein